MPTIYLPYDPQQQMFLHHALPDWLLEGHLAYVISDRTHALDLSPWTEQGPGRGGTRLQRLNLQRTTKILYV